MSRRILLVEDDAETADYILKGLREEGYTVEHMADGRDGFYAASGSEFDAIVMDRMIPGMDGLSVVKALRAASIPTPTLFLSALSHLDERVTGLRAGGDDYLTKPFGYSELSARLENLLRRRTGPEVETQLACGDLVVDLLTRRVSRAGQTIDLLPREFRLLEYLFRNAGQVLTRTMVFEAVWDYRSDERSNVIDVHISRLRKKIDPDGTAPLIHTLRGSGYVFRAPD